jgi:predicted nucleotidyltransferase
MNFGLQTQDMNFILSALRHLPEIERAAIFGSRAKGNFKPGSDVDIAIWGEKVNFDTISRLHAHLEDESPMPYFFDVVDYTHLTHQSLKDHIDRVGIIIYERDYLKPTSL